MKHLIWIFLLVMAMTGCSTVTQTATNTPPAAPKATWADRQASLNRIQSWWLSGKIAVQTPKDSGSASVDWSQRARQYTIAISGPLGSHSMRLAGSAGHVTLQTDGKTFTAKSPEQLLARNWGFQLPVSNMRYWMRGLPVPGIPSNTQFDQYGRLRALQQQGWRIEYASYANNNGVDLPERVNLVSPAMRVKVIVYQWRVA